MGEIIVHLFKDGAVESIKTLGGADSHNGYRASLFYLQMFVHIGMFLELQNYKIIPI
jgi:hypothetical protein